LRSETAGPREVGSAVSLARILVLAWYYEMSRRTGKDTFMLPPSGHLYAYPASLEEEAQDRFVAATEQDARLLGTRSTVDWEWGDTWQRAEREFLPKYARAGGAIGGVFPVNVPYMFPAFTWPDPGPFFKVLEGRDGGKVVLCRPRESRYARSAFSRGSPGTPGGANRPDTADGCLSAPDQEARP